MTARNTQGSRAKGAERLRLQLIGADLDGNTNLSQIWWAFRLRDDRLDQGEIWLHVETPRCARSLTSVFHTDIDGFAWAELDDAEIGVDYWPGWPLDDPELVRTVHETIERELVRVDVARTLLAPVTIIPWRSKATRAAA